MKYHLTDDFVVESSAFAKGYGGTSTYVIIRAFNSCGNRLAIWLFNDSGLA
ncbi:MAG: hypothetical protein J6X55_05310 [Victivallales bacterium]|nr:hypothetical protein [Victivallales bacterium]